MTKITAAIVGGTGYTGVELIRLLSLHPMVEIKYLTSRSNAGKKVSEHFPSLRGVCDLAYSDLDISLLCDCDVVFFATPHGVALKYAKQLLDNQVKVIDLAADFRLKNPDQFEQWYKMPHTELEILEQSVYGLSEINRSIIKTAKVVGNPGCYPTTFLLGLQPLLALSKQNDKPCIQPNIIIDAKSGTSGAGRKADVGLIVSEASDNFKAYAVSGHRHHAEMLQGLNAQYPMDYDVTFVPHLLPMIRGMFSTIYVSLTSDFKNTDVQAVYDAYYQDEMFIDVLPAHLYPETRSTRASNKLRISVNQDGQKLIILVVQDNLVKGAAGQAVQNLNLMFGFDEQLGLSVIPVAP